MAKPKKDKKSRRKRLLKWLAVDIAVAVIILTLLLRTPSAYTPSEIDPETYEPGQVHPYLTQLSADFYNGAQMQEPFDFVVEEKRLNDAIADWSEHSAEAVLYAPVVRFRRNKATFMATADLKGFEFIVTIAVEPAVDDQGRLDLRVDKVRVGAMALTPIAKWYAANMYADRVAQADVDTEHWRTRVAGALFSAEPFLPIFPAEDKKVRAAAVSAASGKLTVHFVPAD